MTKLGFNSQLAIAEESTYGTYVAGTRTLEFVSESLSRNETRIESNAIRGQGFRQNFSLAQRSVSGDIQLELGSKGLGIILEHAFGSVATALASGGAATYDHTFTPGSLDTKGLSIQIDRDGIPFSYLGCKVASLGLSCQVGQFATMTASIVAQDEDTGEAAVAAAYPSAPELLTFVGASLSLGGTTLDVQSADLTLNNTLKADRWKFGSRVTREPVRNGFREVTGSFEVNFEDLTLYNQYVNGTEAELILTFQGLTATEGSIYPGLVITCNVRTDGTTPQVSGPDEIMQNIPFTAFATSSDDGTAITAVYTSADATP